MHRKGVREYFERIANIETGSGDEILIFASSRCETIFISMWNNFLLNTIFRVMIQIGEKVENSIGKILKRKVVQCFMLNVHLAFTLALAREISKIQHLIYSKTQNRLDLAGKGKTFSPSAVF